MGMTHNSKVSLEMMSKYENVIFIDPKSESNSYPVQLKEEKAKIKGKMRRKYDYCRKNYR